MYDGLWTASALCVLYGVRTHIIPIPYVHCFCRGPPNPALHTKFEPQQGPYGQCQAKAMDQGVSHWYGGLYVVLPYGPYGSGSGSTTVDLVNRITSCGHRSVAGRPRRRSVAYSVGTGCMYVSSQLCCNNAAPPHVSRFAAAVKAQLHQPQLHKMSLGLLPSQAVRMTESRR